MATCKHGESEPHGEIGKDWCAGPPRSWFFESFRGQLEEQMNLDTDMFTYFAEKRVPEQEVWALHPHSPLLHIEPPDTDPGNNIIAGVRYAMKRHSPPWGRVLRIGAVSRDSLKNFVPEGWYSEWGERWYDVPIYNSVVDDLGFDPLFRRSSPDGDGS